MSTPTPNPTISTIEPSKSKTWWAVIGGLLTVVVPLVLSVATSLPDPWPALIGAVVAVLTATGVYRAPYKPEGTTVVPTRELEQVATPLAPTSTVVPQTRDGGGVKGPWD